MLPHHLLQHVIPTHTKCATRYNLISALRALRGSFGRKKSNMGKNHWKIFCLTLTPHCIILHLHSLQEVYHWHGWSQEILQMTTTGVACFQGCSLFSQSHLPPNCIPILFRLTGNSIRIFHIDESLNTLKTFEEEAKRHNPLRAEKPGLKIYWHIISPCCWCHFAQNDVGSKKNP